ncbi:MAG: SUMF1/EgtB/PvdO family nonheme iron enzyme, partial [Prosthecobacter sp.]|nr:SUMF1/EgtB/PvdO family nonheme iron enzyme [Prosthecobacter sp.]
AGRLGAGEVYRLPSDHEWSCAVGIGEYEDAMKTPPEKHAKIHGMYPWGTQWPPPARAGNLADTAYHEQFPNENWTEGYTDGYAATSPVGSFPANDHGLYDMSGNVWQWCEDFMDASTNRRVMRGCSYSNRPFISSNRKSDPATIRFDHGDFGFRCVIAPADVTASSSPKLTDSKSSPAVATKDSPFINTLGMKFVPVPIGGGPTEGKRVLFSIWDTRVQDYLAFARANKVDGRWQEQQMDGVPVGRELDHPVVGVNWEDAQAFCQWLTAKETAEGKLPPGMKYRLTSDEEWSWAVGLPHEPGATPAEKTDKNTVDFPWGIGFPPPGKLGNYADETFHAKFPKHWKDKEKDLPWIKGYNDGYATTSPVGSFQPNAHGLYDMGGNVWQWCEDWFDKDQQQRVLRGASWEGPDRGSLQSSRRRHSAPKERGYDHGFRCVLAAAGDTASASPSLPVSKSAAPSTTATKEAPFINSLGMKFVPVPGPKVLFCMHATRVKDYAVFAREVPALSSHW